jgi:hypothetical protein
MKGPHPFRKLQQRILEEVKSAARDDLIALGAGVSGRRADVSIIWRALTLLRPGSRGPVGGRRAFSIRGTACRCGMPTGRQTAVSPLAPSGPAPPVLARPGRVSSPVCARWRLTGPWSATSMPPSPRRTGPVKAWTW